MGFFTNISTNYVSKGNINLDELFKVYQQKLGSKYQVEFKKAGSNVISRTVTGKKEDSILVAKNAYHRTEIDIYYDPSANESYFRFNEATLKGWLGFLNKQTGLIGSFIISLCYGKGQEFYTDVINVVIENYKPEERQINTGLSALWNK